MLRQLHQVVSSIKSTFLVRGQALYTLNGTEIRSTTDG